MDVTKRCSSHRELRVPHFERWPPSTAIWLRDLRVLAANLRRQLAVYGKSIETGPYAAMVVADLGYHLRRIEQLIVAAENAEASGMGLPLPELMPAK